MSNQAAAAEFKHRLPVCFLTAFQNMLYYYKNEKKTIQQNNTVYRSWDFNGLLNLLR